MQRLASLLIALAACSSPASSARPHNAASPPPKPAVNTDLVLIVSNQSFAITPIDLVVKIDGVTMIDGKYSVDGQHTFTPHTLHLAAGTHTLEARTVAGRAVLTKTFELAPDKRYATLMYWFYPKTHYEPTPEHFSFDQYAQQPIFD